MCVRHLLFNLFTSLILNRGQQLLSLDLECLISQGIASLSEKQNLIDEALSQSYEIALGCGAFGHCLVNSLSLLWPNVYACVYH